MALHQSAAPRVLIVEDEYYLADDTRSILSDAGAEVLGPVATVAEASGIIDAERKIDAVLLDVNLRGEMAFEVADTLRSRAIPFAFVTGYDRTALPQRFADAPSLEKPVRRDQLLSFVNSLEAGAG